MLERLDLFIWQRIWYFNVRHTFVSNRRNMLVCHEMHDYWLFANIRTFGGIWMKSSCFPVLISARITAFHALHTFVRKMHNCYEKLQICRNPAFYDGWAGMSVFHGFG